MVVNLKQYSPRYYDGSYEMDELLKAEDTLFDDYFVKELDALWLNQFLSTADAATITYYEGIVGIVANPATETLEFRRSRVINRFSIRAPYTMPFLRGRLDAIIGKGKYTIDMDYAGYTLTVEASAVDQLWFEEIRVMINNIKPVNIVFKNVPFVTDVIKINEGIQIGQYQYNYRAGTTARTSLTKSILSIVGLTDVLGADTMSIRQAYLDKLADFSASEIASVLINDTLSITTFSVKSGDTNVVNIQYVIPASSGITIVNNIKLRDAANTALTNSPVYFNVSGDTLVKHTIPIKEGV